MSTTLTLAASGSTVLDGSGDGEVAIGPALPGTSWSPQVASVSAAEATVTNEAQCKIFGPTGQYIDGTLSGSTGDSTANVAGQTAFPGQTFSAVWTGGDPGATVTLTLAGQKTAP